MVFAACVIGLLASGSGLVPAAAQVADYPNRLIKVIVAFPAGSGSDTNARRLGQIFQTKTGQSVVIDNRAGANGFLAAEAVKNAAPDGYTLLFTSNTTHAANPSLFKSLPYDPIKDFTPVGRVSQSAMLLVVPADSTIKTVAELTALAKSKPGKLSFGSGNSSSRIAVEIYKTMAGLDIVNIPYKGVPQALTDVMGRQTDFMIADIITALPLVKGGQLRALAVTTAKRNPHLPDVPTMSESGLDGYEMVSWTAAYAPAGTPQPVIAKLNLMMQDALKSPEVRAAYDLTGAEPTPGPPEALAAFTASEIAKWGKAIKAAGIQPE
jgi:tripartite-type tricarboxylate transporter receptor subunit TctC